MSYALQDINKRYIPSAKTNILDTLKRAGFQPPSEDKAIQKKWELYRHLATRNEKGGAK